MVDGEFCLLSAIGGVIICKYATNRERERPGIVRRRGTVWRAGGQMPGNGLGSLHKRRDGQVGRSPARPAGGQAASGRFGGSAAGGCAPVPAPCTGCCKGQARGQGTVPCGSPAGRGKGGPAGRPGSAGAVAAAGRPPRPPTKATLRADCPAGPYHGPCRIPN